MVGGGHCDYYSSETTNIWTGNAHPTTAPMSMMKESKYRRPKLSVIILNGTRAIHPQPKRIGVFLREYLIKDFLEYIAILNKMRE